MTEIRHILWTRRCSRNAAKPKTRHNLTRFFIDGVSSYRRWNLLIPKFNPRIPSLGEITRCLTGEGQNWVTVSGYMPLKGDPWYIWYQNMEGYLFYKSVPNIAVYYKYVVCTERWNDTGVFLVKLRSFRHDSAHLWCASALWHCQFICISVSQFTKKDRNGLEQTETDLQK